MVGKKIPEIDQLFHQIRTYKETNNFYQILKSVASLRNLSAFNAALIHLQKPGTIYAATPTRWKNDFNRYVKSNARPLIILNPFGPVELIYEYNDTEGDPLPEEIINPFKCRSEVSWNMFDNLIYGAGLEGIEVSFRDGGTGWGGHIQVSYIPKIINILIETKEEDVKVKKEEPILSYTSIVLNQNQDLSVQFTSLLHELGHYYCGHLKFPEKIIHPSRKDETLAKFFPVYRKLPTEIEEFEAETVCWLVCQRFKIENESSVKYIHNYMKNNQYIPENISFEAVLKAVNQIEGILKFKYPNTYIELLTNSETRKNILEKKNKDEK
jgi:hypothetical protein